MNKIRDLVDNIKAEGILSSLKLIFNYLYTKIDIIIGITNFKNSVRFRKYRIFTSCDIKCDLPKTTKLGHPVGIVIGKNTHIGDNVQINQNVTIGNRGETLGEHPIIQDNVTIYSSAIILGDVTLKEGCTIGANSVVLEDVEEGKTVVGAPATEL